MDNEELQRRFGATIRRLRRERGISQERLANEAGVDRRYMSDVENGLRNLSLGVIERLAGALCISLAELFSLIENQE